MPAVSSSLLPILMLFASNVFMTFAVRPSQIQGIRAAARYHGSGNSLLRILAGGAANRWGSAVYSTAQLKTMQEMITLVVFATFSVLYLKEPLGWNHALGFFLIAAGAFLIFHKWA